MRIKFILATMFLMVFVGMTRADTIDDYKKACDEGIAKSCGVLGYMYYSMFKFLVILRLSLLKNHREAWYCNDVEDSKRPKSFPIMCFLDGTN